MRKTVRPLIVLLGGASLIGALYACGDDDNAAPPLDAGKTDAAGQPDSNTGTDSAVDANDAAKRYEARATLAPTGLADAGNVTGTVDFVEENGTVAVTVQISGATPGQHGMHIHANNSCDANDAGPAGAAGGHWNPADAGHGFPDSGTHHPGDFGNIEISGAGTGTLSFSTKDFTVQSNSAANSALDHAVIFHQGTDDGVTQPTGNSGGRAGCGKIVVK